MSLIKTNKPGFTIVELLVVIVVIGILAAITIVSYTGISQRAVAASIQSDLANASQKLKMYQVENGAYPTQFTNDGNGSYCPTPVDTRYCFKTSPGNSFPSYAAKNNTNPQTYILNATMVRLTTM
jgi:prepilin-type N-terminal cleavage/methylation domain-containing protein